MRKSVIEVPSTGIGDISDGYHTFNELYHHRAILFSVICNNNKEIAWKSRSHHDGSMYPNMFIVGINTPKGQATYHYDVNPYWRMFEVQELEFAPEWDGHTPDQAIERIKTLSKERTVTELVSENAEMYVDLAGGVDYTVDTLIRHKWPEEKPEYDSFGDNDYLVYDGDFVKATYHPDGYFYYYNADGCVEMSEPIYWWNLPEVKE